MRVEMHVLKKDQKSVSSLRKANLDSWKEVSDRYCTQSVRMHYADPCM